MAVFNPVSTPAVAADEARPRRRFRLAMPILLAILLLDTGYLYLANHASGPPRIPLSAFAYEGSLLLHLGLGLLAVWGLIGRIQAVVAAFRERQGAVAVLGALTALTFAVCLLTGLAFLGIGFQWFSLSIRLPLLRVHDVATYAFLISGALYLLLRARRAGQAAPERKQARVALRAGLVFGLPFAGMLAYTILVPTKESRIVNPTVPPMTAFDEGDGKDGKFFPASVQSVDKQFFPSEYFVDSKSCGVQGCHPDIYAQWNSSAHHLSSFNNQWYRKAIEYMQEVGGVKSSKWCGGCHDMAVLLTEDPKNPSKSRFDVPIAAHDVTEAKYPESHAGIGCAVCHSIVHVKSTMGNSDYMADYPPMHKYIITDNSVAKSMQKFLTRLAPEPHKKTFLRPIHTDQTAKFCSSCHKVHLDVPVNGYRWFRGFNDYDSWQGSGVSGFGAVSFYYPSDPKTNQPAFKKCADCHMPNTPSQDAGNFGGQVHSHRFPGANTALPTAYHDPVQMETTVKFLQDKALSIDIFALRRQKAGEKTPKPTGAGPSPGRKAPTETPQAASLNGDDNGPITAAANASKVEETLTAPLNRGGAGAALRRGENPLVEVVVRTLKLGHAFPGGTIDAVDCWVELEAKDETGRVFYHSGKLQWPDGPVEEGAEKYRSLLVDGHSNPIFRRNAWAGRSVVYAKVIPPGAADAVHFRLPVPKDCGKTVTLTAKLNYRKFNWLNNQFAYRGHTKDTLPATTADGSNAVPVGLGIDKKSGPVSRGWDDRTALYDGDLSTVSGPTKAVPVLPITVLAQNVVTLPVVDANGAPDSPAGPPLDDEAKKKERIRWNDYGIGLLLQGDFRHANNAFEQVTKMAPKWPEGYVNIGRVRQAERDSRAAQAAFEKAFALYDAAPTPMTPYQKARTQFFYAQTQFDQGKLDDSLATLAKVIEVFPEDRNVRNLAGTLQFRLGHYDEGIAQLNATLSIDPEDIAAHYNLMKCYRGKGDPASLHEASVHEALYRRFKADETTTDLIGPYQRAHPADNNLSQRIHEHADAIVQPKPAWLVRQEQAIPHTVLTRRPNP